MDNVRLRRLKADHEALRRLAHLHPRIEIEGVFGNPPERYRIRLKVRSLRERGEVIETADDHRLEVSMPRGYPRDAPLFRMLTPVFHPNIAPHAVCIGDDWTASEPIDALIQRVGEILAFQSYNTKSPLNGRAAQWVDEHRDQLPIDASEFFIDLATVPAAPVAATGTACSNCGTRDAALVACGNAVHQLCGDCAMPCKTCQRVQCLSCGEKECPACANSAARCKNCGGKAGTPKVCPAWHVLCGDCAIDCPGCQTVLCLVCNTYPCPTCGPRAAVAT